MALATDKPLGEVRSFVGKVSVSPEGKSWRVLSGDKPPLALKSGDWLRTIDGRAGFYYYSSGAVSKLMGNTQIRLQDRTPKGGRKKLRDLFAKFRHVWSEVKPGGNVNM